MASVWAELKRRNVIRVAVLYIIAAWVILQVADVLFENLGAPDWAFGFVLGLLILFFFPALILSWVYEMTPEGIKRESEVDRAQSITGETGRRLDLMTIAIVVAGIAILLVDRFVLESRHDATPAATSEREESGSGVAATMTPGGTPIIAVLPFKATGSDDGGFLATGLHDDLLTRLAKLDAFKVISRTSMMEYAETVKNMRQIGQELGAGYILEGGVQALGNRVRINAQLIDAAADEHLWADTYDRELNAANLFDIQAELAIAIAGQLQITLSPTDRSIVADVPTHNTDAYNAYLRGLDLHLAGSFSAATLRTVISSFEEAVALDPDFGLAWARLSVVRSELAQVTGDEDVRDSALTALAQARELAPEILETELAWAVYLYRGLREYEQAVDALEAIGGQASLDAESLTLKAWLYRRLGRFDDAYEALLGAQQTNPRNADIADSLVSTAILRDDCEAAGRHAQTARALGQNLADTRTHLAVYELECTGDAERAGELLSDIEYGADWHLWTARESANAARDFERALALAEIPLPQADRYELDPLFDQIFRAFVLHHQHRDDESAAVLDVVAERLAEVEAANSLVDSQQYSAAKAWYHSMLGDADATRYWIEEDRRRLSAETKGDRFWGSLRPIDYAGHLADVGLHDEAINELRAMFEEPGGHGFRRVDGRPDFDALKNHPGYIELKMQFGDAR